MNVVADGHVNGSLDLFRFQHIVRLAGIGIGADAQFSQVTPRKIQWINAVQP